MATQQEVFGHGLAVITGAGAGIGEGLARHLAGLGMTVVVADIDEAAARRVAGDLPAPGRGIPYAVDVRDGDAVAGLARWVRSELGPVRLLIANAGLQQFGHLWDTPVAGWQRVMEVNVNGVFHCARAFLPDMLVDPGRSHVLVMASIGSVVSMPMQSSYIVSKHAVLALAECLHQEIGLVGADVNVAAVLPGAVLSDIFSSAGGVEHGDVDAAERHRRDMFSVRERAISPAEAGETIVEQAAQGEFYIVTQPDMVLGAMRSRAEQLAERRSPAVFRSRFVPQNDE
ncbi:SDR family NAD(P)-dependent oxidoreductase [Saccharopolyspora flava]|uniref:NADP-dependent 3-hydroxy acid dehydrogenase YdfG n=1 Tax=Saccharopolyspora flava TaxID=95161 RepID=A0A1I6UFR2_9PSEU|nr:SDR family oxidoreductase [Saccharopolyspora flava]SFT00270.1 NADP-dependent 3-hydroxy acid dehydrogenase YdfG [Saccharopolyspora flava]